MSKTRYIALFQDSIKAKQSARSSRYFKKGTTLKGILINGQDVEVSLSINARTEVFIAGQNIADARRLAPDHRIIRFYEPLENYVYATIQNNVDKQININVFLIVE